MNCLKNKINKRGQEEMVGFGFIIIIVAIILVVFISFSINDNEKGAVESYEIESFIQAVLQYTSSCEDYLGHLSIQSVIYDCQKDDSCLNGEFACDVLEKELGEILESSWQIEDRPVEAYSFMIYSEQEELMNFTKGNETGNYKGSTQKLPKDIEINFKVHY